MGSYSYSMLSTALTCAYKYKRIFVDKIPSGLDSVGAIQFGTALHSGLHQLLKGNDGKAAFDLYWELERGENRDYGRDSWESLQPKGHTFLERFERLHKPHFEPVSMEERLYSTLGPLGIGVEGTADFIGNYKGVPSIVDFKTAASPYLQDRLLFNPQLWLYAYLARESLGYHAEQLVYMVFVKNPEPRIQVITTRFTQGALNDRMDVVYENLIALEKAWKSDTWLKNPNNCQGCNFFSECWK